MPVSPGPAPIALCRPWPPPAISLRIRSTGDYRLALPCCRLLQACSTAIDFASKRCRICIIWRSKTGERANLGILYRDCVLYIAGVEKPALPTIYSRFGKNAPAHCCSLGKAILAFLPEAEVRELLSRKPLTAYTPTTITSRAAFMKELAETRQRGYAIDRAEHVSGSYCVAAPIFDAGNQPIGAIGVSGRELQPMLKHHDLVRQTAEIVSHHLL